MFTSSKVTVRPKKFFNLTDDQMVSIIKQAPSSQHKFQVYDRHKISTFFETNNLNFTPISTQLKHFANPWKNPASILRCNFFVEGSKVQYDPLARPYTTDPTVVKVSLLGASILQDSLFDGKLRSFSTIFIYYSGFGASAFGNYHIDSYLSSFVTDVERSEHSYTEAMFTVKEYGVQLKTRYSGEGCLFPQKQLVSLSDCGVNKDDVVEIFKINPDQNLSILTQKDGQSFCDAMAILFENKGILRHKGTNTEGLLLNVSEELPNEGYSGR